MRKLRAFPAFVAALLILAGLFSAPARQPVAHAQEAAQGLQPSVYQAVRFAVSPPLRDLPPDQEFKPEDVPPGIVKTVPIRTFRTEAGGEGSPDGAVQQFPVILSLSGPTVSFDGLSSQDNATLFGFRVFPPDTNGDVGPNHYVQIVNLVYRVYDKTGAPLIPARKVSSIFTALGAPCGTRDDGDPIALYDPLADRWLISQFCTVANPNNHQVIAISQTADPTGAYFLYDFMMPNNKFNDYPHFGVWPDGYYMTDNQFNQAGTAFLGAGAFAFDRAKMLVGDPTASFIYFDLAASSSTATAGGVLPADMDGLNPPPPGTPNYFSYFTANEFGDPADALRVFEFHANFATPAASTFTERAESPIAVAAFNPLTPPGRDDIEQPPPAVTATASLDSISDRLMHRLAYRNFGGHESLVVNHTVNVGTGTTIATHQAGVRYYELRRSLPGGSFGVNEQATFAPDTDNRWMGSAAMDNQGNLAVGYSVSSLTTYPSIRYAGRLSTDPPGGLFQGETSLVAGTGVQTATGSRWGDYSALAVDPSDDCTFWYTTEYYTAASQATSPAGWLTRVGNFKFTECTPAEHGTLQGVVTNAATLLPIAGAVVQTSNGFSRITDGTGSYSMTLPPGTYGVTASRAGFAPASASATVTNGGTTTQSFALTPIPIIMTAGAAALTAESCGPATGAIDPGETVSVDLSLKNTGAGNTVSLVGTLLATGGVTSPSTAQSYGVVLAGGPAVTRTFSFTADPSLTCGGTLTATLALQDGTSDLGMLSFTFQVGALGAPITNTYSTGDIGVPIPDVSTVEIPIAVPDTGSITDVNVRVRLNHTFDGDLVLTLVHPDGTTVALSSNRGGSGDDFGSGANDCSGTPTVFDDSAAVAISAGIAPFAGSFRPEQPLSGLNGKPSNGTWKLRIADTGALDVGTVFCVKLEITRQQFLCCPFTGGTAAVAAAPPATLTAESCGPNNGAPDADETVSMSFPLRNVGTAPTTNLVATLMAGGGVNAPSGPQSYGLLSPVGGPVAMPFSFVASGACGSDITATLSLDDVGGAGPLGTATFTVRTGATATASSTFSNTGAITILDTPRIGNIAPSSPYPSAISVSGVTGTVSKVTAKLTNLSHTFPSDIDMLLVGPGGQKLLLMSDVGGGTAALNATLTFDDAAPAIGATVVSGTFRPTNIGTGDTFPAPAPVGPYPDPQLLSAFNGFDPNGTWNLFVVDDVGADSGSIAGGWSLTITTAEPVCCSQACSLGCPADFTQANDPNECDAGVSFADPVLSGSCGVVSCAPPSGSIFPVGTTPDTCTGISTIDASTTAMCGFNVTVQDAQTPLITCPANVVVRNDPGFCSARVNPGTATAADNCPGATVAGVRSDSRPVVGTYPVGTTGITWTATDGAGLQASCRQTVMVNQAPTITGASVSNPRLWPPNHKMVSETVSYSAADSCASAPACALSVMSNEPINGLGDGDTAPDWQIVDAHHVLLRAERSGTGTGRTYTIAITCTSGAGNPSSQALTVRVPHSQSQP